MALGGFYQPPAHLAAKGGGKAHHRPAAESCLPHRPEARRAGERDVHHDRVGGRERIGRAKMVEQDKVAATFDEIIAEMKTEIQAVAEGGEDE